MEYDAVSSCNWVELTFKGVESFKSSGRLQFEIRILSLINPELGKLGTRDLIEIGMALVN